MHSVVGRKKTWCLWLTSLQKPVLSTCVGHNTYNVETPRKHKQKGMPNVQVPVVCSRKIDVKYSLLPRCIVQGHHPRYLWEHYYYHYYYYNYYYDYHQVTLGTLLLLSSLLLLLLLPLGTLLSLLLLLSFFPLRQSPCRV